MSKLRVGVIFGGKSTEHEVSLQSAKNIINGLDRNKYDVCLIGINKQGHWHEYDEADFLIHGDDPSRIALNTPKRSIAIIPGKSTQQFISLEDAQPLPQIDVIFPIVHGNLGEDGSLQGLLRMANLPFVGPGVLGSSACMDKDVTKRLLRDAGLQIAPFITLMASDHTTVKYAEVVKQLGLPLFIKPANQGSSVGISKVTNESEFNAALDFAFLFDVKVLVESAVKGREIECAVLGNEQPVASPCGEIVLHDSFYAYHTKYIDENGASVVAPADLESAVSDKIREIALRAYRALNCCGMSRVDVFLTEDNQVIINEINTLPGFTNISMYPKLWQQGGMTYQELISRLIDLGIEKYQQTVALKTASDTH
ncbi:D-alanine--D-alanine ligase [Providencia vermicola]|uniref:D-alanine--D-alanine ligase n=1 Tax=Providencia TaxID=586 RepID=UPI00234A2905|nr:MULTISPECIES: D-alanine--D-alanine ligase [Providencia]ELR5141731.1 D-alanine--D-alanine ligase [Providencia stuartii]WER20514.1 D-alanine--D-alanine ligase [Providencia stuartii]WER24632.1 D-alanine--D-alanine ligase [Providencia stuartii]WER28723.1 D-alanine--D-alanine ligase [Providencia stuartii]